ncbi:unnamed protein product [Protopolystoma xenopodis]|uniref:Uncharacterized protein n=1 Tax=Protopolystoma xenopodis TaxID=117903 RepID=A0A448WI38_9PLAT|nr:unnamed protein product [Protopolystoma xenopodis]
MDHVSYKNYCQSTSSNRRRVYPVSISNTKTRESDLERLLEAIDQQSQQVCLDEDPRVKLIRRLLTYLADWRRRLREALSAARLGLTTVSSVSRLAHAAPCGNIGANPIGSAGKGAIVFVKPMPGISVCSSFPKLAANIYLEDLKRELSHEFPAWALRMPECQILDLVN